MKNGFVVVPIIAITAISAVVFITITETYNYITEPSKPEIVDVRIEQRMEPI